MFSPTLKKGSMELLLLSLLADNPCHGYEIGRQIEERSGSNQQHFWVSNFYMADDERLGGQDRETNDIVKVENRPPYYALAYIMKM